ncbi:MAG: AMP-dependent synthetase/ligase [candidate division WOR-3 bacterium]
MAETIYQVFSEVANKFPKKTALLYKVKGRYQKITFEELRKSVSAVAQNLLNLGIKKNSPVAIFSYNRPEWVIADLAILQIGAIVVPIYHILPDWQVKYILNDSNAELIFIENAKLFSIIANIRNELTILKRIVVFDDSAIEKGSDYLRFDDWKVTKPTVTNWPSVTANDIATYVYTSGTTGEPKGVILTHRNILTNVFSAIKRYRVNEKDIIASFLPLAHMFERTCGYYTILLAGGTIGYVESLETIAQDIKTIRPTLLITVPRVLEKVYEEVTRRVSQGPPLQRKLVQSAVRVLNRYTNLKYRDRKIPLGLKIKRWFYNWIVGAKFRKLAGGRVRLIVSGGAALNKKIAKIYHIFGFNIVEGYGLTETAPVVCANAIETNRFGTVGKPFDDVLVKIGANNEILVKGPNVMIGYLNKPAATAAVIDKDGWFHTGDQGRFDEYGNLIITGRIKELIVTSYGKNIAPVPIEQSLTESVYIDQAMVYGDKKKCLVALIVPQKKVIEDYADANRIAFNNYPELLQKPEIKNLIQTEVEKTNQNFAHYEQVKSFALLAENFTVENGLLTPTLKVRRDLVVRKYWDLIESLYQDLEQK